MPVFKVCLKILQKNLPVISIYFIIFIAISIVMTIMMGPAETGEFGREKVDLAFFAGEETPLVSGLREALTAQVNFVPLTDETEKLQEALFYRRVHYILRVPDGFTTSFLRGGPALLQRTSVPDAASAIYIDLRIDRYLEILRLYVNTLPALELRELVAFALDDLSLETEVMLAAPEREPGARDRLQFYFNFLAYTILFVIIIGMSSVFLTFNGLDLKRRNLCSPLGARAISLQCYLACAAFALAGWLLLVLISLLFGWREIAGPAAWFYILNSLVFTACAAGLAYLVGNLTRNKEVVLAAANIVALGSSFLGGVFVPQELLGENVLKIASFTPTYWYVRANAAIAALTNFNLQTLADYFAALAVQTGFALAFVIIALVVVKHRQTAS
jgi:ABC-2 type transport system permease protein